MKSMIIAAGLLGLCGAALAQDGGNAQFAARRQTVEAFCSSHAQDCSDLKELRENARQVCQNQQSTVGACRAARETARAKQQALEAEGFPLPPHSHLRRPEQGDAEAPPPG